MRRTAWSWPCTRPADNSDNANPTSASLPSPSCACPDARRASHDATTATAIAEKAAVEMRVTGWTHLRRAITLPLLVLLASAELAVASTDGTFDPQSCTKCQGLQYCTIMNGQYLFDPVSGYTREATAQLEKQGVCEDLDAKTLALSGFGSQLQFKSSPACQALVWNFHCLSWVATTFQRQVNGTAVSCASTEGSPSPPLPPCRSLCVEVADKCVYSHFYRLYLDQVCGSMACYSEADEAAATDSEVTFSTAEATCVNGAWAEDVNRTMSRCSTRAYEPPVAAATVLATRSSAIVLGTMTLVTAVYLL